MTELWGTFGDSDAVVCFGLLLARAGGWVMLIPMLGAQGIARFARIAFAALVAFALTPIGLAAGAQLPTEAVPFLAAAVGEVVIGALLGWLTGLLFAAAEMAGALADMTSGLSFASMVDPNSGQSSSSFARLFSMVFLAVAFAADAHHTLIAGFAGTLEVVPPGVWPTFDGDPLGGVVAAMLALMRAAIEIGAPLLGALFLTEVALGLISKFYPQANILIIGISVKGLVALSTAALALMLLPSRVEPILEWGARTVAEVFGG